MAKRCGRRCSDCKSEGVFRKIGISAYVADDPAALAARFRPDVMQLPFSLLDQRLLADGTLARLKELGVEVHARSLFLQGLLSWKNCRKNCSHAAPHLDACRAKFAEAGITPLAAALGFVLARPEIAFGLVGVTSRGGTGRNPGGGGAAPARSGLGVACALKDESVLTPSLW